MRLLSLTAHESSKSTSARLLKETPPKSIERLELKLVEAEILFDQRQNPVLAVRYWPILGYKVESPPGPTQLGYLVATDSEVELLRRAGYTLADWRAIPLPAFLAEHGLSVVAGDVYLP